jgi:hypothetical protein
VTPASFRCAGLRPIEPRAATTSSARTSREIAIRDADGKSRVRSVFVAKTLSPERFYQERDVEMPLMMIRTGMGW